MTAFNNATKALNANIQRVTLPFSHSSLEINDSDITYSSHRLFDFTNKKTPTIVYANRQAYTARYNRAQVLRPEVILSSIGRTVSRPVTIRMENNII